MVRAAQTMQAAFVRELGGAEKIEVGRLPVPDAGPTDLLVRMEASAVNHVDLFVRSGAYQTKTPFPFVIGRDLVGTVEATGPGVVGFSPGDRVWTNSLGHAGRQGAFSEYAVVGADRLYTLPDGVDPSDAAPVLHATATAHIGLVREAALQPGETVFIAGGGGAVGSATIQLARAMGAHVVTSASADDGEWCRSLGADVTLDYRDPDLAVKIGHAAPAGVDVWWDNSGHHDFEVTLPLLRQGARVIMMAGMAAAPILPVGALYTRDAKLCGFAISNASVSDLAGAARVINSLLAEGGLVSRVGATFRLADAAKAHEALESGDVRGRVLVVP
ncbi:NADPH:quinone reductase [Sinomonas sp. ASV486]|uniref:NADPH:quinone reductase n=1 Tax=Sinomonas sp. ASV486 TaxID=3051170 RepID=UPI0027DCD245|nr:NADPH:quinone reductase [Sinomonas sp. ASV486]MDQ4491175.1 NADPH:quinone reductase [Sinomonas sp. ASV486]MDQ4491835.1 NADPH:quinone reductase [Sinomonas sp. ASV486]MDQ4491997.1 NADPH:quinone reductase [Sinomonas sp. ASV486]